VPAVRLQAGVALVTGAARRLGREIALGLGREGFAVAVHYGTSAAAAEATVAELGRTGARTAAFAADLSRAETIPALVAAVEAELGGLDVLVNSAASFERRALADIDAAAWDAVLAVNLRAPFLLLREAAALLARSARSGGPAGVAINVADLSAVAPWRGYAHHGASKAALVQLTRAAALELAPDVRVNAILPGAVLPPDGMSSEDPAWAAVGGRLPLQRPGEPRHVVEAVRYLVGNDFVTGEALVVDGGELLLGNAKP
jgi:pteridine reductase